jgi:hypothetical protein
MKRASTVFFALVLLVSLTALAQDSMQQGGSSPKPMSITGKISDDGKTFTNDKDGKSWTIVNPDAVKGHEGHHVVLKAHVYPDKNEVHVISLKMAGDSMNKGSSSY